MGSSAGGPRHEAVGRESKACALLRGGQEKSIIPRVTVRRDVSGRALAPGIAAQPEPVASANRNRWLGQPEPVARPIGTGG